MRGRSGLIDGIRKWMRRTGWAAAGILAGLLLSACGKEETGTAENVYVSEAVPGGEFSEGTFLTQCSFKVEGDYLYYLNGGIYRILREGKLNFEEKELVASREELLGGRDERIFCFTVDRARNLYYFACPLQSMTPALYKRSADGREVYRIALGDWESMSGPANRPVLAVDEEENLYALDQDSLLQFDREGNLTDKLFLKEEMADIATADAYLLEGQGGTIYFLIENKTDRSRAAYEILTGETMQLKDLKEALGKTSSSSLYEGLTGPLIREGDDWLYQYNPETGISEKLLCWQDCDVYRNNIQTVIQLSEERILVLMSEIASSTVRQNLLLLTRLPAGEAAQKEQVTLVSMMPSGDLEKSVVKFNQTSDRYHVTIQRLSEDNEGAQARLDSALASEEGAPDLVDLTNMDIVKYAETGALEDLYQYMGDGEIRGEAYLSNLLEGYTFDGKLACIPKGFRFLGLYVTDRRLTEAGEWTMEKVMEAADQVSDAGLFPDQWDYDILSQFCGEYILGKFVDLEKGECCFDGEEFCSLLEWVRRRQPQSGTLRESMMTPMYVRGYNDYQEHLMALGEETVLRGTPSAEGREVFPVLAENALGIPVNAGNKEGAWAFLLFFLQNEETDGTADAFPTSLAMLDRAEEKAVTPLYAMTGDGEPEERPHRILYRDGNEIEIYALPQSAANALRDVLERIDFKPRSGLEQAVITIVEEEAGAFLNGQKTASETADIIQNRVGNLINESR